MRSAELRAESLALASKSASSLSKGQFPSSSVSLLSELLWQLFPGLLNSAQRSGSVSQWLAYAQTASELVRDSNKRLNLPTTQHSHAAFIGAALCRLTGPAHSGWLIAGTRTG
jgi:hypothetical protein